MTDLVAAPSAAPRSSPPASPHHRPHDRVRPSTKSSRVGTSTAAARSGAVAQAYWATAPGNTNPGSLEPPRQIPTPPAARRAATHARSPAVSRTARAEEKTTPPPPYLGRARLHRRPPPAVAMQGREEGGLKGRWATRGDTEYYSNECLINITGIAAPPLVLLLSCSFFIRQFSTSSSSLALSSSDNLALHPGRPKLKPLVSKLVSRENHAATHSCMEQEKSSLLQFLHGLSWDSGLAASWRRGTDCCRWEGITCSPNRTITDVSLAYRGLEGSISPFLGNLTSLLRLNLSGNLLSGGLPPELVQSSSITVLDVSFNRLTGGLSELPSSTPGRPLQVLNISSNLFTGRFPSTTWEVMKSLVVLNASTNSFTGQIPIMPCVSAPSFAVLELSFNQFSGNIPQGLSNCSVLKLLAAGYNNLSGTLPEDLFNVTSLEHLSLPSNWLEGPLSGISKLTNLVALDLGRNEFSGNIPESIGDLKRLEELHLDHNNISGELPSSLINCTNLIIIDLKNNNFSGELTKLNFSSLTKLKNISNNNLEGPIPTTGQLSTFPGSSFEGNPKLCGPMIVNHCGSTESDPVSIVSTKEIGTEVFFAIAFGVFFVVGVLYDQIVLARHFG
uniref:Uncharacterized protein n=1 Tax=Avena sativa TaxID=4498 RepID=A0ACD5V7I0_AVESA